MERINKLIFLSFILTPNIAFASCYPWSEHIKGIINIVLSFIILIGLILLIIGLITYIKNRLKKKPVKGNKNIKIGLIITIIALLFSFVFPVSLYRILEERLQGCYRTTDVVDFDGGTYMEN